MALVIIFVIMGAITLTAIVANRHHEMGVCNIIVGGVVYRREGAGVWEKQRNCFLVGLLLFIFLFPVWLFWIFLHRRWEFVSVLEAEMLEKKYQEGMLPKLTQTPPSSAN